MNLKVKIDLVDKDGVKVYEVKSSTKLIYVIPEGRFHLLVDPFMQKETEKHKNFGSAVKAALNYIEGKS